MAQLILMNRLRPKKKLNSKLPAASVGKQTSKWTRKEGRHGRKGNGKETVQPREGINNKPTDAAVSNMGKCKWPFFN